MSGESADGGTVGNGPASLTPPEGWENGPVAVHVGAAVTGNAASR